MLLFGSTILKYASHFYYWNQRVCYLHCHEAGLCCYLVIHIENLLTSITAVLLPFVAYLLTVAYIQAYI
jgi:hypothetical protein